MSKTQKIMVAVDFSQFSKNIADYAGRLAEDLGAELIFVNVINQRDVNMVKKVSAYTDKLSVKGYINDLKELHTAEIQKIVQETNCTQIPNRFIIKIGVPFLELIETAKAEKADMVIMGTKGRSNIAGTLLGSQAEKMFRHCPIPLLSIRETDDRHPKKK